MHYSYKLRHDFSYGVLEKYRENKQSHEYCGFRYIYISSELLAFLECFSLNDPHIKKKRYKCHPSNK